MIIRVNLKLVTDEEVLVEVVPDFWLVDARAITQAFPT